MAKITRTQKLINLHSSSALIDERKIDLIGALDLGEIAVQHVAGEARIYTKFMSGDTGMLAEFVDKVYVDAQTSGSTERIAKLEALHATGDTAGTFKTVADEINQAIQGLDATNNISDAVSGIAVKVDEVDGKVQKPVVTVTLGDIADGVTSVTSGGKVFEKVGDINNLTTSAKTNLVAAINEVKADFESLDATVSGENESKQIKVEVVETDGKLTSVSVTAGKFDVDGAAISAYTASTAYTEAQKNVIDAYTVNSKKISESPVLNGADIKLDGYAKASSATAIATSDTVNAALGKLEYKVDNAISEAITGVTAGNGIEIDATADTHNPKISAKVKSDEKVLAASADGLNTTLNIDYNSTARTVELKGINDALVSSFDASAFIKDGMLYGQQVFKATATTHSVTIKGQTHEYSGLTTGHTYLAMCFSNGEATGTTYSWDIIDVTDLVDVYTAGDGLQLSSGKFSIKLDTDSESFLTVGADGLKLSGVNSAITSAIEALDVTGNTSDAVSGIAVKVEETDGKVQKPVVTVTAGSVASGDTSVVLGGAVYTAVENAKSDVIGTSADTATANTIYGAKAYAKSYADELNSAMDARVDALESFSGRSEGFATAAQGEKADSAIQSVKVNGTALIPDSGKTVDVTAVTSIANYSGAVTLKAESSANNTVQLTMTNGEMSATLNNLVIDCGTF